MILATLLSPGDQPKDRMFWMTSGHIDTLMPGEVAYATNTGSHAGTTEAVAAELLRTGPWRDSDRQTWLSLEEGRLFWHRMFMGYLIYDGKDHEFEDRLLAHLKVAIGQKLRRLEPFYLNWNEPVSEGSGRTSIWVSPYVPLTFRFSGSRQPEINAIWAKVLEETAHHAYGMQVVTEEQAEKYAKEHS